MPDILVLAESGRTTVLRFLATTRPAMAPTVRHEIRISSTTAVFEVCVTSQATWSSNARVWPAP